MSGPRPARRLPARVYWVRRGLVLALAVLLAWTSLTLAAGEDEPVDVATAPVAPRAGAGVVGGPARPAPPDGTDRPGRADHPDHRNDQRPRAVTVQLPPAATACDPGSVVVEPAITGDAVAGEPVELQLMLSTTSVAGCRLVPSDDQLLVQVTDAGGVPRWDTQQCPGALPDGEVALRPGWQVSVRVVWSGRLGDRGCTGLTLLADPGTYAVHAAVVGGEPGVVELVLAARSEHRRGDGTGAGPRDNERDSQRDGQT